MLVAGVSVTDPDGDPDGEDTLLRVDAWAEQGRVALPGAANASSALEVEEGVGDDGEGDGSIVVTGNETALNLVLAGLVYYPPPDWTSFTQVLGATFHQTEAIASFYEKRSRFLCRAWESLFMF